jgi:MSHA biogenesis protein MshE
MGRPEKIRLGEILVQQKLLTEEQLKAALDEQKKTGRRLGRVFIERGFITEEQISKALARQLGADYIDLKHYSIKRDVVARLPETQARRFRAMVLEDRGEAYLVGMADPTDLAAYDDIARILKRDIELAVVTETELLRTIDRSYRRTEEITGLAQELQAEMGDSSAVDFGALAMTPGLEEAPVVKLLQTVFEDATQARASDIHIEPQERRLQIRFRIDGVLHLQTEADSKIAPAVVLRLKLMSGLDIAEKRMPQDGRFNVKIRNVAVDVRISTMPTQYGESVVMRLRLRRRPSRSSSQLQPQLSRRHRPESTNGCASRRRDSGQRRSIPAALRPCSRGECLKRVPHLKRRCRLIRPTTRHGRRWPVC